MSDTATPTCLKPIQGTLDIQDVIRKAMATSPPDLATDEERLAYYRGFLVGAGRQAFEGSRFARYEDLVFRIAAEQDRRTKQAILRLSYEDMVSVGYEAVLEMIRKKADPDRSLVAMCIRRRLVDTARQRFGKLSVCWDEKRQKAYTSDSRHKGVVYGLTGEPESAAGEGIGALSEMQAPEDYTAEGKDLWREMLARLDKKLIGPGRDKVDERLKRILHARIQGKTLKEIGEDLALTETRVCQILREAQPWLEEHVLPLAEPA